MRRFFLTEKSSALEALRQHGGLSGGAAGEAAAGHLLDTKYPGEIKPEWDGFDPAILPIKLKRLAFKPGKGLNGKSHRERLDRIAAAMRATAEAGGEIVIATDSGREGSLIGWEILVEHAKLPIDFTKIRRLHLTANTAAGIRSASEKMQADPQSGLKDYAAYQEARCRQVEDWLWGMNGSILLNAFVRPAGVRTPWGYGPVQLALLALLADREFEIAEFTPEPFWRVAMSATLEDGTALSLVHAPTPVCKDPQLAEEIRAAAESWSGPLSVSQRTAARSAPKLFSGNGLAKRAAKLFGWAPDKTEKVNQALYEKGLLTYPRTESEKLPSDQKELAPAVLAAIAEALPDVAGLVPATPTFRPKHYVADPGEHHAIVPTDQAPASPLTGDEALLYELIARTYLAAHMPDAIDAVTVIEASVDVRGEARSFRAKGIVEQARGWRAAFTNASAAEADDLTAGKRSDGDPEAEAGGVLPPVDDGARARSAGAERIEDQTRPPPRITRGGLGEFAAKLAEFVEDPELKAALIDPAKPDEPRGLGTAASLKGITPHLFNRAWIKERGKGKDPALVVTPLGQALIRYLRKRFDRHAYAVQRAIFEKRLSAIGQARTREEADRLADAFLDETLDGIDAMIAALMDAPPIEIDPSEIPQEPPSPKMLKAAQATAARLGVALPPEAATSYGGCKAFLDAHPDDGAPSPRAVSFAKETAERLGEAVPPEALTDRRALKAWTDDAVGRAGPKPASDKQLAVIKKLVDNGATPPDGWPTAVTASAASAFLDAAFGKGAGGRGKGKSKGGRKSTNGKKRRAS